MKLPVYDLNGELSGEEVELRPSIFEVEPNDHALALAVQAELTNRRQGTHATKNRALVRGGGRKPWRQKGRGAARVGTIRSPLWRGGGIIFGPQPHPYKMQINKKVSRIARRSAFTYKARENKIKVLVDFNWEDGKTASARNLMRAFALQSGGALILTAEYHHNIHRACKNIPDLEVIKATDVSARQILKCDAVLIQKGAISSIHEVLGK